MRFEEVEELSKEDELNLQYLKWYAKSYRKFSFKK